ncbi:MAG: 5-methylthioadenosine/S-adenosylhomocysteine nucleosidase [Caloramator sp.]|jgi:nucleoside phosphorylase|uniref:5'-methylthioadenosine/S-adenosylhomocysteine nucleosidase family protein n=1 Tax=Caloramator sp. TaxID=1871330 RepID=UPI001D8E812F|nr:hypothetical protein [Caloramator sp.]MBZ4663600.1 5-methylthioadenosine/S-adenosylhomocysteine nucleosidase [Caloramator sp.]
MIYISTAMYIEAQEIIKRLGLKRDNSINKFEVFKNDEVTLIITGVGKVKSAVALTYLLSRQEITQNDLYINFGICGTKDKQVPQGEVFLCSKITDNDTKFTYYSDLLIKHPFKEASIETFSNLVFKGESDELLVDMEASSLYQAASVFFKPHQIFFIKVVSDYLDVENIDKHFVIKVIEKNINRVIEWINYIKNNFNGSRQVLTQTEEELIKRASENLKMSATMENEFRQLMIYHKLLDNDITELIDTYLKIECKSKNEGKMHLAELKRRIVK